MYHLMMGECICWIKITPWECEIVNVKHAVPQHLAWHETMELHELTAFQSTHLALFKQKLCTIEDPELRALYMETICNIENNLRELLRFYPAAPQAYRNQNQPDFTAFEAAGLLGFAKTSVRNYSIAITETATPVLRDTFQKHLNCAIYLHACIFNFMYARGYYPSYNLDQLLAHDIQMANAALSL